MLVGLLTVGLALAMQKANDRGSDVLGRTLAWAAGRVVWRKPRSAESR